MNKILDSDLSRGDLGITLVKGEERVIVDKGSPAETTFREQGYVEEGEPAGEAGEQGKHQVELENMSRSELNVLASELNIESIDSFTDNGLIMTIKMALSERDKAEGK